MHNAITTIPAFEKFSSVTAFFTTRFGGVSNAPFQVLNLGHKTGDDPGSIQKNWEKLASKHKLDLTRLKSLNQVHSDIIKNADVHKGQEVYEGDCIYTSSTRNILTVLSADCLPILIYDSENNTVAAVHAGWRGTQKKILLKTLEHLKKENKISELTVHLALGPCISQKYYEVGPEVAELFDPNYIKKIEEKLYLDLLAANLGQIKNFGIPKQNISSMGYCTYRQSDYFFSLRREGPKTGRMAAVIKLA